MSLWQQLCLFEFWKEFGLLGEGPKHFEFRSFKMLQLESMEDFSQPVEPGEGGHSGVSLGKNKYVREDYGTREKYFKLICDEF